MTNNKEILVTGDRPTGNLHLGHYVGTLENRLELQQTYNCYFLIADLHMLTTHQDRVEELNKNINELVPAKFKKTDNLKKTGLAGIFSASLELTREGIIKIMQTSSFDKLLIKDNNE